jgi:hypothetical protein
MSDILEKFFNVNIRPYANYPHLALAFHHAPCVPLLFVQYAHYDHLPTVMTLKSMVKLTPCKKYTTSFSPNILKTVAAGVWCYSPRFKSGPSPDQGKLLSVP